MTSPTPPIQLRTKEQLWAALKEMDAPLPLRFRDYTSDELRSIYKQLTIPKESPSLEAQELPALAPEHTTVPTRPGGGRAGTPSATSFDGKPLRVEPDTGIEWFREEVRKPAIPQPRAVARRTYINTGVKQVKTQIGDYVETYEVPGEGRKEAEATITLPSYQVGCYKDPRMPFKIHVYNGNKGFDYFEVGEFYGGHEFVPHDVKTIYVENVLCYDIRLTIRAIEAQYNDLVLQGKIKE